MAGGFETRLVLDGLVCLFEDFNFLDDKFTSWVLPKNVMIKTKSQRDFKGVQCLKGKRIAEVRLGYFKNKPISVLIASSINEQIPFSDIRKFIAKGVDRAIRLLGPESNTKAEWYLRCCKEYEKWINRRICNSCLADLTNTRLTIKAKEKRLFGEYLCEYLRLQLERINLELKIGFYEFGQDSDWSDAASALEGLNIVDATEIVVHVARDYSQKGKVLLWKREAVRDLMGGGAVSDFFCYFTGKHGNFVFDLSHTDALVGIMNIKFYSDMFKQVHQGKALFRKPCVISALLDAHKRGRATLDYDEILNMVAAVGELKDLLLRRKFNCARVEAIISVNNDEERGITDLLRECAVSFEEELGQASRLLSVFEFIEFENQVNNSLTPALKTLMEIAKGEKAFREVNPVHCANIETLHLAMACEMIISYFIYGKLDYWSGYGPRFDKNMRNILKLNGSTFRFAETFRGLDFANGIVLCQGELCYTGKLLVDKFVSVGIADEENRDRLANCFEILASNEDSSARLKEVYQVISEIIWDELLLCAEKTSYRKPYSRVSLYDICKLIATGSHLPTSSRAFVKSIMRNSSLQQQEVRRIIEAVMYVVGSLRGLQKELEFKIENEIWRTGKSLFYPADESWKNKHWTRQEGKTLVILPTLGAGDQRFSTATDDIKKLIAYQYRHCFYQIWEHKTTVSLIIKDLARLEHYKQTDHRSDLMQDVFREFTLSYLRDSCQVPPTTSSSTREPSSSASAATAGRVDQNEH